MVELRSPFPAEDIPRIWAWIEPFRWRVSDDFSPKTLAEFVVHFRGVAERAAKTWAVYVSGELGGVITYERLSPVVGTAHATFKKSFWGQKTTLPAIDEAVNEMLADRPKLSLPVIEGNKAMMGLLKKLGATQEGVLKAHTLRDDEAARPRADGSLQEGRDQLMPMVLPFIPLIAAGLGVGGSLLASGSKTTTQQPTLSPELQSAQDTALSNLTTTANDPMAGLGPVQQGAQDSINTSYKTMPNIVASMLAQRGMGSSGGVGTGTYDVEGARLGSLSSLYSQMAQLGSQRQLSADQIINSMIATGKGLSTTTPSNSLAAGLTTGANDLSSYATLATLAKMINQGNNPQLPAGSPGSVPNINPGGTGSVNANTPVSISDLPLGQTTPVDPTGGGWGAN